MACPNCVKKKRAEKIVIMNNNDIYVPKQKDFVLKFYTGHKKTETSVIANLGYVDLVFGQQYYVHTSDINKSYWSDVTPVVEEPNNDGPT